MAKVPVKKIILIVWVVFSICYVVWGEWNRFSVYVMQRSYQQGVADTVGRVIEESKTCKAFPVNVGERKATLINVDCLKPAGDQGNAPAPQK